jgi:hypothetical protein
MIKKLCLAFLIFSSLSCNTDPVTKQLEIYLKEAYGIKLPEERTYYALIPATQCPSCVIYNGNSMSAELLDKVVIVSGFSRKNFDGFKHYYFDSTGDLARIKLLEYNSKIFVTENRKVITMLPLTNLYAQLDSLEKLPQ